jgi:hypothetical protein
LEIWQYLLVGLAIDLVVGIIVGWSTAGRFRSTWIPFFIASSTVFILITGLMVFFEVVFLGHELKKAFGSAGTLSIANAAISFISGYTAIFAFMWRGRPGKGENRSRINDPPPSVDR